MSLTRYRDKRDFSRTPEPAGKTLRSRGALKFVIQKHAARRLHYDFRLELDGVLKSWAVPKGPSIDPADKRLAVHVEDHPMEYGGFEGVIPEKQYGAGEVILWDRGTWSPLGDARKSYREGHLKFHLEGEKLHGLWALVRMHARASQDEHDNWLLIKEKDDEAKPGEGESLVKDRPESVASGRVVEELRNSGKEAVWNSDRADSPAKGSAKAAPPPAASTGREAAQPAMLDAQLATLVTGVPAGEDWLYEVKFDGYRLLARIDQGKVKLYTRNRNDWTAKFRGIADACKALGVKSAWLDGEACVMDAKGRSSFGELQKSLAGESEQQPVYMVFDLPYLNGRDLRGLPLHRRKEILRDLLAPLGNDSMLRFSDHLHAAGADAQVQACKLGLEGLIGKRPDGEYVAGRSRDWIKLKCRQRQEFVIGGYTPPQGARSGFGALLLGVYDKPGVLTYAGRVGTGFDQKGLVSMLKKLKAAAADESPFAGVPREQRVRGTQWVRPELVAEVTFQERTGDGLVRQAAFEGLREDKPARRVGTEKAMAPPPAQTPRTSARRQTVAAGKGAATKTAVSTKAPEKNATRAKAASGEEVAGIVITHPGRVIYPEANITKLDVARYYERMAARILPYIRNRPLSIVRCPAGTAGACFFQKHTTDLKVPGVETVMIEDSHGVNPYIVVNSAEGLVGLAQMGTLELHAWNATMANIEKPDMLVMDFDPDEALEWHHVTEAAEAARALFEGIGLTSFVKTTGGKGLHVVVPLAPRDGWDEVKEFSRQIALRMVEAFPDRFTATVSKAKRTGKIFIDYLRNGRGSTAVTPYSLRARAGATVATPLDWRDLKTRVRSGSFTLKTVEKQIAGRADPWQAYPRTKQFLTDKAKRAVGLK